MLIKKTLISLATASAVLLGGGLVFSHTAMGATATTSQQTSDTKLVASYSVLAGSPDNAESLVNGLRTGTVITLVANPTGPNPTAPSANLTPATGKLGYGNINIALALAKTLLSQDNITNPTPTQLATALNSVLGQRSQGMGWGQIAKSMGVTLGSVVSASHTGKSAAQADREHLAQSDNAGQSGASHGNAGSNGGNHGGGNGGNGGGGGGKH